DRFRRETAFLEDRRKVPPVVDADREPLDPDRAEEVMDDEDRLDVRDGALGPDRVEVALHELAVAPALRVLAAPHGSDVVPLERQADLARVLRDEARQRHGEVEAHRDAAFAVVGEAVELLVGLLAALAGEDLFVLERGRVDREEAVRAEDLARRLDQRLARDRLLREVVPEAFQRARLDLRHGGMLRERGGRRERSEAGGTMP